MYFPFGFWNNHSELKVKKHFVKSAEINLGGQEFEAIAHSTSCPTDSLTGATCLLPCSTDMLGLALAHLN